MAEDEEEELPPPPPIVELLLLFPPEFVVLPKFADEFLRERLLLKLVIPEAEGCLLIVVEGGTSVKPS